MNGKRDTKTPVKTTKLTGPALQRAYENALHVLDRDAAILDQLRSRANILLAALAIGVTALGAVLASATLHLQLPAWFVVLAVVFLGSAIFCCVGVLWPTRDHGDFTSPELERARDEAAAAALVKTADAEREAAIAAGAEAIRQARADAEVLIRAAELELAARAAGLELVLGPPSPPPPLPLPAPGSPAPGSPAPGSPPSPLRLSTAEASQAAITLLYTHAVAGNEEAWAAIAAAQEARDERRKQDAEARDKTVADARDPAAARVAVLERRRPLRERACRAWKHLTAPWKCWGHALGRNQRLWKTVLGQQDLAQVPLGGPQDEVDRVLLESLYLAHERNLGTLSRRADLLRIASLLVFAFVVAFGIWLSTTTPTTSTSGHPSSSAPATGRPSDLGHAHTAANHAIAVGEPGRIC